MGRRRTQEEVAVSIITPAYNEARFIQRAIDSVLLQRFHDFEWLVVDDASTDGTAEIVARHPHPQIRLLRGRRNRGKARCMNRALRRARGRYVLELDADDWLERDALRVMTAAMDGMAADVAMIYGNRRGVVENADGSVRQRFLLTGRPYSDRLDFLRDPFPPGPRFYRAECLRRVGGWPTDDPSRGRLYEDVALILRLLDRYRIAYVDATVYNMSCHGENVSQLNLDRWWDVVRPVMVETLRRWGVRAAVEYDPARRRVVLRQEIPPRVGRDGAGMGRAVGSHWFRLRSPADGP